MPAERQDRNGGYSFYAMIALYCALKMRSYDNILQAVATPVPPGTHQRVYPREARTAEYEYKILCLDVCPL